MVAGQCQGGAGVMMKSRGPRGTWRASTNCRSESWQRGPYFPRSNTPCTLLDIPAPNPRDEITVRRIRLDLPVIIFAAHQLCYTAVSFFRRCPGTTSDVVKHDMSVTGMLN